MQQNKIQHYLNQETKLAGGEWLSIFLKGSRTIEAFTKWLDHFAEYMLSTLAVFGSAKCQLPINQKDIGST